MTDLDYRRFAALTGSHIKRPVQPQTDAESENDSAGQQTAPEPVPSNPPELKPQEKSKAQIFTQLRNKLDAKIDDANTLTEFIKIGYEIGEFEILKKYITAYLGIHARDHGVRFNLGMIMLRMGETRKAKLEFRKILGYNPKFQHARDMLEKLRNS